MYTHLYTCFSDEGPTLKTLDYIYYPYSQYTNLFIFRFVSLLYLRSTLRLFYCKFDLVILLYSICSSSMLPLLTPFQKNYVLPPRRKNSVLPPFRGCLLSGSIVHCLPSKSASPTAGMAGLGGGGL